MDAWTFIWLMLILKIPIAALFYIVRWAIRQVPESESGEDGGLGSRRLPSPPGRPRHPRPHLPRLPRRGPHRTAPPATPERVRAFARARSAQH